MKPLLMHRDRDFEEEPLPWNAATLTQDLALDTLLDAMARDDKLVRDAARAALLSGWRNDPETILHRQSVLRDALSNPAALRELYALTVEAIERKRKDTWWSYGHFPSSVLYGASAVIDLYVGMLRRLRDMTRERAARFTSDGFRTLFAMLDRELTDDYLAEIAAHLANLRSRGGTLISAELGPGNVGRRHVLHRPRADNRLWIVRLLSRRMPAYSFRLHPRDEAGARALSELQGRGIDLAANALAQSADHVDAFFRALRRELAFYVGCVNLHERLTGLGDTACFPRALAAGRRGLRCHGLYEPCLALEANRTVVGNTVDADRKSLVIVTGANQGGKSVFLRSVGVAQLMMQCGMFVAAESFEGELCSGLVTHFKREEDATLKSGKLDEELARVSEVVDHLAPNAMLLFNESFGATNEREGSEIARQVVSALVEKGMKVFFVTHQHAAAHGFWERAADQALFLRAERLPDGTRTFRMLEGEPLATSHGRDLFERIFETTSARKEA